MAWGHYLCMCLCFSPKEKGKTFNHLETTLIRVQVQWEPIPFGTNKKACYVLHMMWTIQKKTGKHFIFWHMFSKTLYPHLRSYATIHQEKHHLRQSHLSEWGCDGQGQEQKCSGIQSCKAPIEGNVLGFCVDSVWGSAEFVPQAFQVHFDTPIPANLLKSLSQVPVNTIPRFWVTTPESSKKLPWASSSMLRIPEIFAKQHNVSTHPT